MTMLRTATLAATLVAGATSLAIAQNAPGGANGNNGMPPEAYKGPGAYQGYKAEDFQQGNTGTNAAASGGGGTHATSQRTGSAANTRKVLRNQNGYRARMAAGGPGIGAGRADIGAEGWRGGLGYGYGRGYGYGYGAPYGYGYSGLYNYAPGNYGGGYQAAPGYAELPGVYYGEPPGLYNEFVGYQWGR
jgi:hypothetical protein